LPFFAGPQVQPPADQPFLLPGASGRLEALFTAAKNGVQWGESPPPIAIVCHPHPLYGGTLNNKVVHMVARAFNELGIATLRFNFRGVGQSQGEYDQGQGETDDLLAVADWFRRLHPGAPLWLAGFSFGAFVAFRAQARLKPQRLLLVAPPVSRFAFPASQPVLADDWLVIQGGEDDVVDPDQVSQWVQQQSPPPDYRWLDAAGHFFHGRLMELKGVIHDAWGVSG
jgi:alpha/beta superfamily hydrolase